jgi:hypothetical protein
VPPGANPIAVNNNNNAKYNNVTTEQQSIYNLIHLIMESYVEICSVK